MMLLMKKFGKFLMLVKLEISSSAQETGLDTQIAQSAVNLSGGQKQELRSLEADSQHPNLYF